MVTIANAWIVLTSQITLLVIEKYQFLNVSDRNSIDVLKHTEKLMVAVHISLSKHSIHD